MLYIDLVKSEGKPLGGKYVARTKTGIGKDGQPKWRYFKDYESYKHHLEKQSGEKKDKPKERKESLKQKMESEGKGKTPGPKEKPSLFLKTKKEEK